MLREHTNFANLFVTFSSPLRERLGGHGQVHQEQPDVPAVADRVERGAAGG